MSVNKITVPPMLDSTGLSIVTKLNDIKNAVQPTNACVDIDISLPTSGWSGEGPYTYTYSNSKISSGCAVSVKFLESETSGSILAIDCEKVVGGVRFTSDNVPTSAIPVRVHIENADAESVMATTADEVSTDAVPGQSNVQDALETLNDHIANLFEIVNATPVTTSDIASLSTTSIQLVTNKNYNDYHVISVELFCGNGWCKPSLSGIVSVGGKLTAQAEIYNGNSTGSRSFTVDARFVLVAK